MLVEMKLLLTTTLLVFLTNEIFAGHFAVNRGKELVYRLRSWRYPGRDCRNAEKDPCKYCGCPGRNTTDVCTLIRCRNDKDCTNAKADPCNHCGCKDEKGADVCIALNCAIIKH